MNDKLRQLMLQYEAAFHKPFPLTAGYDMGYYKDSAYLKQLEKAIKSGSDETIFDDMPDGALT